MQYSLTACTAERERTAKLKDGGNRHYKRQHVVDEFAAETEKRVAMNDVIAAARVATMQNSCCVEVEALEASDLGTAN